MPNYTQNQTAYPVVFRMLSALDGITPLPGLTVAVQLSKNGGSFANSAGSVSEIGNGAYKLNANATDFNTLGPLAISATATNAVSQIDNDIFVVAAGSSSDPTGWDTMIVQNGDGTYSFTAEAMQFVVGNAEAINAPAATATNGTPLYVPTTYTFNQSFIFNGYSFPDWTQILFTAYSSQGKILQQVQLTNGGQTDDGMTVGPTGFVKTWASISGVTTSPFACTLSINPQGMNVATGVYLWEVTVFNSNTAGKGRPGWGLYSIMPAGWTATSPNS
jgi:hypothetical protein